MASPLIIQPSGADTYVRYSAATTNFGTETELWTGDRLGVHTSRSILRFDFSALPAGVVITAAELLLYYATSSSPDPAGETYWVYELTQTGWVETEATWNIYKTGSNWASAGGDYTTTDGASLTVPASPPQNMTWNVLNLAKHFQANHACVANFLVRAGTSDSYNTQVNFASRRGAYAGLRPKLTIAYAVSSGRNNVMIF
jgi:hypothetical protein